MPTIHPARARLRLLLRRPVAEQSLAEAALYIAWEDQGVGNPLAALRELDGLAAAVRGRLPVGQPAREVVLALNRFLFGEVGFRGNTWNYNDPANSFLDRVIERRAGLPITLSVVYLEVGWRLGLPLSGAALPGHFLVRYADPEEDLFIDPFNRGRLWSREECLTQIATFYGAATPPLAAQAFEPPPLRAVLARILRNLKNVYLERGAFAEALAATDRIVLIEPGQAQEVRDRGLLRARLNQLNGALEDLERYARMAPRAADLTQIRQQARTIAERAAKGN
ncbi:MAG TPA: transglutaminase-like domain-containing protein [Kouleothrix sp.]|uniref:SirB1 family protein n=1 Tax=Kouleothrix sp. TaxID=2779161 RepID=UPI002BC68385|nr:transglutaminase-like domain-containing protein [Kouleothrix sp.]HRC74237.1 transglutaminase-like domain-containing protein [Kouleothrix sp.]